MLDLRTRTIAIKVNGEWYSVRFKPKFWGRVKDVTVWKSTENKPNGVFSRYNTEISHQDISTVEVLKCLGGKSNTMLQRFCERFAGRSQAANRTTKIRCDIDDVSIFN